MSSLAGNHTMNLLYLLNENFNFKQNLLFDLLITGRNFDNLSYFSSSSLSQRWKFLGSPPNKLYGPDAYGTQ